MFQRRDAMNDTAGFGIAMPVFLGIWLVCSVIAGLIWQNLVSTSPGMGPLTFPATIVLSLSFGVAGAGLACVAIGLFRQP